MNKPSFLVGLGMAMWTAHALGAMSVTMMDNGAYYSSGNGGEFRAVGSPGLDAIINWSAYSPLTQGTVSAATDGGSWGYNAGAMPDGARYFQTFCIQMNTEFVPGGTYNISLGKSSVGTGANQSAGLAVGTAWLYSQFASGHQEGYDYTYSSGRSATAGQLQTMIWWLQGQLTADQSANPFYSDLVKHFGAGKVTAAGATTGTGVTASVGEDGVGVAVLRLTDDHSWPADSGNNIQNQLVMVIPEPTTILGCAMMAFPFGVSALRVMRKKA